MSDTRKPPEKVRKRDGRLVPFESDKISRALFAAAEEVGLADAFLARELADGVVFFLASEGDGSTPSTAEVAELVVKVVRELGQPAVAAAFAAGQGRKPRGPRPERREGAPAADVSFSFSPSAPLADVLRSCARRYGLAAVYSRDLAAVEADGLLTLFGVESPKELAACVSPMLGETRLADVIAEARQSAAGLVAVDGLEDVRVTAPAFAACEIGLALQAAGLRAVVNLNAGTPPAWASDPPPAGSLFADVPPLSAEHRAARADAFLGPLAEEPTLRGRVRIDWHVGEHDLKPERRERLARVVRMALDGAPLAFAFDRPRRAVPLAEGLDRENTAVLLTVGLHLPKLLEAMRGDEAEMFLHKLGSLVRLALSAAVQKRDFLRKRGQELNRAWWGVERARLLVVPVGLDAVVRRLRGGSLAAGGEALELARQIVQRLRTVLRQDGEACRLLTTLDGLPADAGKEIAPEHVAGLTGWDAAASVKSQLRAAGALQAGEGGTALVPFAPAAPPDAEQAAEWLAWAWQRTDVVRLRFVAAD